MDFSIMFWGDSTSATPEGSYYRRVLDICMYADAHGLCGVWLPERHFHPWGGMHPNPSVLAAAIASVTHKMKIRAGSVVLPLHSPIRVAEEWAVVDNLSHGRVELAIASGWKDRDFVLAPASYAGRKTDMWAAIQVVEELWRGSKLSLPDQNGKLTSVSTYPRPIQPEVPIWITSSGALRTVTHAGHRGYNLLTHLLGQDFKDVGNKIGQFNAYRKRNSLQSPGKVSLMLHTFVGGSPSAVSDPVRVALSSFLLNSADLSIPSQDYKSWLDVDQNTKADLVEIALERYLSSSLIGTYENCLNIVRKCRDIGVTEICCLIDFGLPLLVVQENLEHLTSLARAC